MQIAIHNKRFWMSNIIIIVSLCMAIWFPTDNAIQSLVAGGIFLVALPFFFIRFFLKEKVSSFGMTLGNAKQGILWLVLMLLVVIIGIVGAIRYTDALTRFIVPLLIRSSFVMFLLYIFITGIYIYIFEFFFRGFVFFVWEKVVGMKAIFVQAILFMIFLMVRSHGKVSALFLTMGVMAIFSGFLIARSRSVLYSFLFSYISAILGIVSIILFIK